MKKEKIIFVRYVLLCTFCILLSSCAKPYQYVERYHNAGKSVVILPYTRAHHMWVNIDSGVRTYFRSRHEFDNGYVVISVPPGKYAIPALQYSEVATDKNILPVNGKLSRNKWHINVYKTPEIERVPRDITKFKDGKYVVVGTEWVDENVTSYYTAYHSIFNWTDIRRLKQSANERDLMGYIEIKPDEIVFIPEIVAWFRIDRNSCSRNPEDKSLLDDIFEITNDLFELADMVVDPLKFWFGDKPTGNGKDTWLFSCDVDMFVVDVIKPDLQYFLNTVDPEQFPLYLADRIVVREFVAQGCYFDEEYEVEKLSENHERYILRYSKEEEKR